MTIQFKQTLYLYWYEITFIKILMFHLAIKFIILKIFEASVSQELYVFL